MGLIGPRGGHRPRAGIVIVVVVAVVVEAVVKTEAEAETETETEATVGSIGYRWCRR
jgi:hypothetical protein